MKGQIHNELLKLLRSRQVLTSVLVIIAVAVVMAFIMSNASIYTENQNYESEASNARWIIENSVANDLQLNPEKVKSFFQYTMLRDTNAESFGWQYNSIHAYISAFDDEIAKAIEGSYEFDLDISLHENIIRAGIVSGNDEKINNIALMYDIVMKCDYNTYNRLSVELFSPQEFNSEEEASLKLEQLSYCYEHSIEPNPSNKLYSMLEIAYSILIENVTKQEKVTEAELHEAYYILEQVYAGTPTPDINSGRTYIKYSSYLSFVLILVSIAVAAQSVYNEYKSCSWNRVLTYPCRLCSVIASKLIVIVIFSSFLSLVLYMSVIASAYIFFDSSDISYDFFDLLPNGEIVRISNVAYYAFVCGYSLILAVLTSLSSFAITLYLRRSVYSVAAISIFLLLAFRFEGYEMPVYYRRTVSEIAIALMLIPAVVCLISFRKNRVQNF